MPSFLVIPMVIGALAVVLVARLAPLFFVAAIVASLRRHGLDVKAIVSEAGFWVTGIWCVVGTLLYYLKFAPVYDSGPDSNLDSLFKMAEHRDARQYLNVIIRHLANDPKNKIVLRKSQPLPVLNSHDPGKIPEFEQVRSCLVFMATHANRFFANEGTQLVQLEIDGKPIDFWPNFFDESGVPAVELRVEIPKSNINTHATVVKTN